MRKLTAHYFMSIDGVIDSPQRWHFPYSTPQMEAVVAAGIDGVDTLVMGRNTYQEWEAFWPSQSGFPLADFINKAQKFVASTTLDTVSWEGSTLIDGDVATVLADLKQQPGQGIAVNGSGTLLTTLLTAGLVDELQLLIHPIVLGMGKHLFEGGGSPVELELVEQQSFDNGVVHHTYRPVPMKTDSV